MLLTHWIRLPASRADWTAGSNSEINTAMIAMTTRSSIRVKPRRRIMNLLENEHPAWTGGMADRRTGQPADRRVDLMGSPTGLRAPDPSSEDRIDTTWPGEDPVTVVP